MQEKIIPGITVIDENEVIVCSNYPPHVFEVDPEAQIVHVIEIANARLAHTKVAGGDPAGRIAIFGRYISASERIGRMLYHGTNPESYRNFILEETRRS